MLQELFRAACINGLRSILSRWASLVCQARGSHTNASLLLNRKMY